MFLPLLASPAIPCSLFDLQYEDLLHMEIERLLVKKNALAVANNLLETEEPQESFRKWNKLIKYVNTSTHMHFGDSVLK